MSLNKITHQEQMSDLNKYFRQVWTVQLQAEAQYKHHPVQWKERCGVENDSLETADSLLALVMLSTLDDGLKHKYQDKKT